MHDLCFYSLPVSSLTTALNWETSVLTIMGFDKLTTLSDFFDDFVYMF